MIKVAMIVRSTMFTAKGGDTVQALETARILRNHGIAVDLLLTHHPIEYRSYNLLHFFNLTRPVDILYHIRKTDIPFVISTILVSYSEFDKYHRKGFAGKLFRYLSADTIEYIKCISRWLRGKDPMMSLSYILKGQKNSIHEILQKAKLLLPNSVSEYNRLKKTYSCSNKYSVVPNAVDEALFRFNERAEKDSLLVLCIARIEGLKNQINLIRALNNTKFQLLIIGAPAPNQYAYYHRCLEIAAHNIRFIEHVPQEELVAYYQRAKVHVLPSWFETTGLSSLEAAAMGCSIVVTDKGDTREYFEDHAVYCSPSSPESILAAVEKAATLPVDEQLQMRIAKYYNWKKAGLVTAEGYKHIINKS